MATKLNNEELENVSGGSCGSKKCTICQADTEDKHFWTCKFAQDPNNHSHHTHDCVLCDSCYAKYVNDPHYYDFKQHLG